MHACVCGEWLAPWPGRGHGGRGEEEEARWGGAGWSAGGSRAQGVGPIAASAGGVRIPVSKHAHLKSLWRQGDAALFLGQFGSGPLC